MAISYRLLSAAWFLTMTISAAPHILVHGHRGARAMRPENTIPAFEYAIKPASTYWKWMSRSPRTTCW